jgi:hypothetical protein
MADGEVSVGVHRIEIRCSHVKNGACSDCMWPQIMPYVSARQTLDDLLPKLGMLSEALRAFAKDAERIAKATDAVREWTEGMAAAKWSLAPVPPNEGSGT